MRTLNLALSMVGLISLTGFVCGLSGCSSGTSGGTVGGSPQALSSSASSIAERASSTNQPAIVGPETVMLGNTGTYSLALPTGYSLVNASWDFGDGTSLVSSTGTVVHTFGTLGIFQLNVTTTDSSGQTQVANLQINVINYYDGLDCVGDATISSPAQAVVSTPVAISAVIPSCLAPYVRTMTWTLGDSSTASGSDVSHTYDAIGTYSITLSIYTPQAGTQRPFIVLKTPISIVAAATPTPSPTPVATATPEPSATPTATPYATPSPSPSPTPTPALTCPSGNRTTLLNDPSSKTVACGNGGTKTQVYRTLVTETCEMHDGDQFWIESSRVPTLQSESACQGQSCTLPDGSTLANGGSKTIVSGEISESVSCGADEAAVTNTYDQLSDETCNNGALSTSNTRRGSLKSAGSCPTYAWVATDTWSQCTADCGGTQSRTYICQSSTGHFATEDHCSGAAPTESRACDGNPSAVAHQESVTEDEEGNSCHVCPRNQVGVVVKTRQKTTTTSYACIDHSVQVSATATDYSAWKTESYCRDFVAHRCSQDSLDNSHAEGRYKWMVKCASQDPVIADFLDAFGNKKVDGFTLDSTTRHLYPTFMNHATHPEKPWIAPTSASASCTMPATAYVAAVCVSSCATPEQQILAEEDRDKKATYATFLDALNGNYKYVATMSDSSSIRSHSPERTKVQQWVTEMLDTEHDIIEFHMKSGRSLRLTPNHTIVTEDGALKLASDFKVGDNLVQLGGALDQIVSLTPVKYFGKVYNLFVESSSLQKNIVITNGYLNGTAFYQNEGSEYLNRQVLRKNLTRGVFE